MDAIALLAAFVGLVVMAKRGGELMSTLIGYFLFRKVWINLLIALWITGCGQDDSQAVDKVETKNETPANSAGVPSDGGDTAVPEPTHSTKDDSVWPEAMLVASKEDLPVCGELIKRRLVYIEDTEEFKACDGKAWKVVPVTKNTLVPKDGVAGKDGKDGAPGKDGTNGQNGQDAPQLGPYQWIHPVTGVMWYVGAQYKLTLGAQPCAAGSSYPTTPQLADAVAAGVLARFGVAQTSGSFSHLFVGMWSAVYIGGSIQNRTGTISTLAPGDRGDPNITESYANLCVKN